MHARDHFFISAISRFKSSIWFACRSSCRSSWRIWFSMIRSLTLGPRGMVELIAELTAAPTMTSPSVGGGGATNIGATMTGAGAATITGGGGGGATTVVRLMTVVLLTTLGAAARDAEGFSFVSRLEGAELPMRPPVRVAWASATGAKATSSAARREAPALARRSGSGEASPGPAAAGRVTAAVAAMGTRPGT